MAIDTANDAAAQQRKFMRETECQHDLAWVCEQDGEHSDAYDAASLQMDVSAIMSETRRGGGYDSRARVIIASINQVFTNFYPEASNPCKGCGHGYISHDNRNAYPWRNQCLVAIGPHGTELGPAMCDCMEYITDSPG